MKLKGNFYYGLFDYKECELIIHNARLINVTIKNLKPIDTFVYLPNVGGKFNLIKLNSVADKNPYKSNYVIEYEGNEGVHNKVFIKLNIFTKTQLKTQLFVNSSRANILFIDFIKILFGAIIGYLLKS